MKPKAAREGFAANHKAAIRAVVSAAGRNHCQRNAGAGRSVGVRHPRRPRQWLQCRARDTCVVAGHDDGRQRSSAGTVGVLSGGQPPIVDLVRQRVAHLKATGLSIVPAKQNHGLVLALADRVCVPGKGELRQRWRQTLEARAPPRRASAGKRRSGVLHFCNKQ